MERILVILAISLVCTATLASADDQRLEAEDVIQYGTYGNAGGVAIGLKSCQSASGGFGIGGVDYEGDYIVWFKENAGPVLVTDAGLISARTDGMTATYALLFEDEHGAVLSADTLTTITGTGVSCRDANYDQVWSSKVHSLPAGSIRIKVRALDTIYPFTTRLDCLDLRLIPSAAEQTTWGRIRKLFI